MVRISQQQDSTTITLAPNQSANWQQMRLFIFLISGTSLAIGIFWALVGAWAVLPFSGLEAALVAWFLYSVCQNSYQRQVICITAQQVLVQFGRHFPQRSWTLDRENTYLSLTAAQHHLDAPGLRIYDRQHSLVLGHFLNSEDRELALQLLKQAGLRVMTYYRDADRQL